MRVVWKYTLEYRDSVQKIEMPVGAKILTVAAQYNSVCIWAEVNPGGGHSPLEERRFILAATGEPIEPDIVYVGTAHTKGFLGELVWHVYEKVQS